MEKFIIIFKELDKRVTITASNFPSADKWAKQQLEMWGKESNYNITRKPESDVGSLKTIMNKSKINWEQADTLENGTVRCTINRANTPKGPLYSYFFSKMFTNKEGDVKINKFFGPNDLQYLKASLEEVSIWIECDRDEQKKMKKPKGRRNK